MRRTWLMQGNPKKWDLVGAVTRRKTIWWRTPQHRKEIQVGDRAYMWLTGPEGGVVAVARVTGEASMVPQPPEDVAEFSVDGSSPPEAWRVRLDVEEALTSRVPREVVKAHPILSSLPHFRMAQGTCYPITPEQDQALQELIKDNALGSAGYC